MIIPRGGESLIKHIYKVSSVPIIAHYKGNCHVYVDASANIKSAIKIVLNGKIQRPGVCNAVETLLVHKDIAAKLMPSLIEKLISENVEVRGCARTQSFSKKVIKEMPCLSLSKVKSKLILKIQFTWAQVIFLGRWH